MNTINKPLIVIEHLSKSYEDGVVLKDISFTIREGDLATIIGPSGCGGTVTALDAHIVTKPTHIAGMPVAVNICCHALRHAHGRIEGRG